MTKVKVSKPGKTPVCFSSRQCFEETSRWLEQLGVGDEIHPASVTFQGSLKFYKVPLSWELRLRVLLLKLEAFWCFSGYYEPR